MRVSEIVKGSWVDGPGERVVLFTQGCSHHCEGCQNQHLWTPDAGIERSTMALADELVAANMPITISGGEPFDQSQLLLLLLHIRNLAPDREIIVYTGYKFEQLMSSHRAWILNAIPNIDILVDGRYIKSLDNDYMQYRGSSNQKVIDIQATLEQCRIVELDWDTPELVIKPDGDVIGAAALIDEFAAVGEVSDTRRCGQTNGGAE